MNVKVVRTEKNDLSPCSRNPKVVGSTAGVAANAHYEIREGFQFDKKDAPALAGAINAIYTANNGVCTPQLVVSAARSPQSPFHKYIDWNSTVAADKWRLYQARTILRAIIVITPKRPPMLMNIKLRCMNKSEYLPAATVLSRAQLRTARMEESMEDLVSFCERYEDILVYCHLRGALQRIIRRLQQPRARLRRDGRMTRRV